MQNQILAFGLNSTNLKVFGLGVLLSAVVFSGCATKRACSPAVQSVVQQTVDSYEVQKPIVMRTSEDPDLNRPEWTTVSSVEEDGMVYFTGGFLNGSDYALTVRCANAEGLKVAIQSISQMIRAEFSSYMQGSNVGADGIERYVSDGIAAFVDALHVCGLRQSEVFWEEVFSPQLQVPTYNVFVKLEMTKGDYLVAKADAVKKLRDRFQQEGNIRAKEKAERLLDELKQDFYGRERRQDNRDTIEEYALNF